MPRNYKSKNVQTKPELSGVKNMSKEYDAKAKDVVEDGLLTDVIGLLDTGIRNKRKPNWTPEQLTQAIFQYFTYCADKSLKPSKGGIRLYLGISRSQYHAWQSEPSKYGEISDLVNLANDAMEVQYINRSEKYPTANIFLLKTSHGHIETSKMDVTTNGQSITSPEDVNDLVSKLGLDGK